MRTSRCGNGSRIALSPKDFRISRFSALFRLSWPFSGSAIQTTIPGASRTAAVVGSQIYAGGAFQVIGGVSGRGIGRFDGEKWDAMNGGVTGSSASILTIVENGGSIYAGGAFTNAGGVAVTITELEEVLA